MLHTVRTSIRAFHIAVYKQCTYEAVQRDSTQVEAGHKANQEAMQNAENDVHLMQSELGKDADQVHSALVVRYAGLLSNSDGVVESSPFGVESNVSASRTVLTSKTL